MYGNTRENLGELEKSCGHIHLRLVYYDQIFTPCFYACITKNSMK